MESNMTAEQGNSRPNRPKAYSYLRFSTPEQSKGDSFRRQTEASVKYAEDHGLDLDTSLTFQDLGVSAYRGRNVAEGQLGAFLGAVDRGRVASGSYLLVESLDRLSRQRPLDALNQFSAILERDIKIVTLLDRKLFTREGLSNSVSSIERNAGGCPHPVTGGSAGPRGERRVVVT